MKGIMILSVMMFHIIYRPENGAFDIAFREMIYLSMPLFFLLSGYFYRKKDISLSSLIKQRMKRLLFPAIGTTAVLLLCFGPYFMHFHGYTVREWMIDIVLTYLRPELISHVAPDWGAGGLFYDLVSPVWFVWTLAWASLLFYIVLHFLYDNEDALSVVTLVLAIIGAVGYARLPAMSYSLQMVPLFTSLMLMGTFLGKYKAVEKISALRIVPAICIALPMGFFHCFIFVNYGSHAVFMSVLGNKTFTTAILFIIETFVGGFALVVLANLLAKIKVCERSLEWLGRHTMVILLLHRLIAGIASDIMHTYTRAGEHWYVTPLSPEVVIKSIVSFIISLIVCILLSMLNDWIKSRYFSK